MKIIHCSDWHLDSPLGRNFLPAKARERNAELCSTFARMVRFAVRQQVQAVLIAGDLFDSAYASTQTADFVVEQVRNAPDVTFFYLQGNHDESCDAFDGMDLPPNLKTFGTDWTSYLCGDVVITGLEMKNEKAQTCFAGLNLPENQCNIVMLHGQTAAQSGPDLIPLPMLKDKNIDYLALGHFHSYRTGKLDHRGIYCYSGCVEGRGFDECGEKGFVLLETNNGTLRHRFVPFAARTLHEVRVDISGAETVTQILSKMKETTEGVPPEDLVKFTLSGTCTLHTQKDIRFLQKMLEPDFWFVKIEDESTLKIDSKSYEYDMSLKGEFVRTVMASDRSEADKERIIACGIRALSGEEVTL